MLKAAYRYVLDALEEHTTLMADTIVVNSHFTASICRDTWRSVAQKPLEVLYPVVEIPAVPALPEGQTRHARPFYAPYATYDTVFVSLNRYERKKNIGVALDALAIIVRQNDARPVTTSPPAASRVLLVIAGGYDDRVDENREYLQVCTSLSIAAPVAFHADGLVA
jgi:glycosyltransferase involved in cell wall biosynthesis